MVLTATAEPPPARDPRSTPFDGHLEERTDARTPHGEGIGRS
ncbi:hypothetical protein ACIBK9_20070 [Nonomuraea sp. NPDC050227]